MTVSDLPTPGGDRDWSYLSAPALQSRQVLAAWQVEGFDHVVEIGGYRTPITGYLRGPRASVTVLDPLVVPLEAEELDGAPCRVRHLPIFFHEHEAWPPRYALVLLGLDLELYELSRARRAQVLADLEPVVKGADRIVLEHATDWTASRWLAGWVEERSGLRRTMELIIEAKGDLGVDLSTSWPPLTRRRLLVLDR